MSAGVNTFIYPVRDIDQARRVFGALLGAGPTIDTPYYVQFETGGQRIGLDPNGHDRGFSGAVAYYQVEDVEARYRDLLAAGATEHEAPRDVGDGNLIASVRDADGNIIGIGG